MFIQPFVQVQIKENIKAPRHWHLWGNSPVNGGFSAQRSSYTENVCSSWRHHGPGIFLGKGWLDYVSHGATLEGFSKIPRQTCTHRVHPQRYKRSYKAYLEHGKSVKYISVLKKDIMSVGCKISTVLLSYSQFKHESFYFRLLHKTLPHVTRSLMRLV